VGVPPVCSDPLTPMLRGRFERAPAPLKDESALGYNYTPATYCIAIFTQIHFKDTDLMYKYVPLGTGRRPVSGYDYKAYAYIMSRVRCPKAEAIARFGKDSINRLINAGVVDNECDVGRGWFVSVPLKDVNGEYDS
jgi:hypothetical protein